MAMRFVGDKDRPQSSVDHVTLQHAHEQITCTCACATRGFQTLFLISFIRIQNVGYGEMTLSRRLYVSQIESHNVVSESD